MLKVGTLLRSKAPEFSLNEDSSEYYGYYSFCKVTGIHNNFHVVEPYELDTCKSSIELLTNQEILEQYHIIGPEETSKEPEEAEPTFTLKQIKEAYNNYNANCMDGWNEPEDMFEGFFKLLENSADPDYQQYLALKAKFE